VDWIATCKSGEPEAVPPPETGDPKDLRLFSYFSYTCWQLGDRALLRNGLTVSDLQALAESGEMSVEPPSSVGVNPPITPDLSPKAGQFRHAVVVVVCPVLVCARVSFVCVCVCVFVCECVCVCLRECV
jgi:hypothetical protein